MKNLINSFLAIAAANPLGFTVNVGTMQPVSTGYAVAVAATQNSFGREGLERVINYVSQNAPYVSAVGGWLDTETNLYYFDATIILDDIDEAEKVARLNNQLAFFDLTNLREIRL